MIDRDSKTLIFKNLWHKGDCHLCRPFLKSIAANNPGWKFYRCHWVERTLHDVPMEYIGKLLPGVPVVDVWIGSENRKFLDPQKHLFLGICPNAYKSMFDAICEKYGLICDTSDHIPTIDYSLYEIQKIDNFLLGIHQPCVIVSNGDVRSTQSHNFSMDFIIDRMKLSFTVVTTKDRQKKDEYFIGDIVGRSDEDLSELSYLSTKSYAIIGRASGPYSFATVKENFNGDLKMICIAKQKESLYWKNASSSYWIPSSDSADIMLEKITHILELN